MSLTLLKRGALKLPKTQRLKNWRVSCWIAFRRSGQFRLMMRSSGALMKHSPEK